MRRADRLFQIVQIIRGRRLTTAAFLAQRLEISERTVYRDIADLQRQGVPVDGEAGVGYRIGSGFDLPPLMFTQDEAAALVASARLAQSWVDTAMARDIESALGKILSVLPPAARVSAESLALYAPAYVLDDGTRTRLQVLREAVQSRHKVRMDYHDVVSAPTQRTVRPLGCFYWGKVWTFSAWCELREDFRAFRLDRIDQIEVLPERFRDEAGKTLADMLRSLQSNSRKADSANQN
ncbi:YafY family protein [Variovorax sp. YR216]|uniref:helix-turn-helix transcriptional regulator n=1 Tax=Variovorax sp. YR216 TaxID=1882828 RepID=UPI000894A883|nr:YafY family protein [Variovorax sp. YR216]SEA48333.1 HTH domain-containing protein [Variovorax sp. YR216]